MQNRAFSSAVSFWRLSDDNHGVIRNIRQKGDWSLGDAIDAVMHEPSDQQWRFAVVTDGEVIDHLDMHRLAGTSIFKVWARHKIQAPLFLWEERE